MTIEIKMLIYSVVLGIVQLMITSGAVTHVRGVLWNASSRDTPQAPLTGAPARLQRAFENFKETFPFFLTAVLLTHLLAKNNAQTALGTQLYFGARVIYFPIYAIGIPYLRTLVWLVSMAGLVMTLLALCN
jgi:uncharacterized MAPEG superfamily protein